MRTLLPLLFCFQVAASDYVLPAFPPVGGSYGAEGWGMATTGGRGGRVIRVTTTADSGAGSLRDALKQTGARNIIICVSGWVTLTDDIQLSAANSDFTLVGHLAPGHGFGVRGGGNRGGTIMFHSASGSSAQNGIVYGMRFRRGLTAYNMDVVTAGAIDNNTPGNPIGGATNIVFANCSISWGQDEGATFVNSWRSTIQDCIISEQLEGDATHHNYGGLIGGNISVIRNLYAHNAKRNPRINADGVDVRNNVIFNQGIAIEIGWIAGRDGAEDVNIVNNWVHYGPGTTDHYPSYTDEFLYFDPYGTGADPVGSAYVTGNYIYGNAAGTADNTLAARNADGNSYELAENTYAFVSPLTALEALEYVTNHVGAITPIRDSVDVRLINEVNGQALDGDTDYGWLMDPAEVGGYPTYTSGTAYTDTDLDGMADSWEIGYWGDITTRDGRTDADGDGYTDLEEFLWGTDPLVYVNYMIDFYTGDPEGEPPPPPPPPPVTGSRSTLGGRLNLQGRVR